MYLSFKSIAQSGLKWFSLLKQSKYLQTNPVQLTAVVV